MSWHQNAIIYHIHALGFCGCPEINPIALPEYTPEQIRPVHRLAKLRDYYSHFQKMGITAIYLGPIFESCTHGYDIIDYFQIDRRLGTNQLLKEIINELHSLNIKVIIDGCFHHVSRLFPQFVDLRRHHQQSAYLDWFFDINFLENTIWNDGFSYRCYENLSELPIINFNHPSVQQLFLQVADFWINQMRIDGWRLDVAYQFSPEQWQPFCQHCYQLQPDCFIYGELIEHNYSQYTKTNLFKSATNYQLYQNIWQSIAQKDYFKLFRHIEFQQNSYSELDLVTFTGSHDTNRLHTQLYHQDLISQFLTCLFTMPGIPSVYYGDEINLVGIADNLNTNIRQPMPNLNSISPHQQRTINLIRRLSQIRPQIQPRLEQIKFDQVEQRFVIYHYLENPNLKIMVNSYTYPQLINSQQIKLNGNYRNLVNQEHITISPQSPFQIIPSQSCILQKL